VGTGSLPGFCSSAIPAVKEKLIPRIKNIYAAAEFAGHISILFLILGEIDVG